MVVDTGLMEDPQEPTHAHIGEYAYNRTEYDDMRADSSSVLLLGSSMSRSLATWRLWGCVRYAWSLSQGRTPKIHRKTYEKTYEKS